MGVLCWFKGIINGNCICQSCCAGHHSPWSFPNHIESWLPAVAAATRGHGCHVRLSLGKLVPLVGLEGLPVLVVSPPLVTEVVSKSRPSQWVLFDFGEIFWMVVLPVSSTSCCSAASSSPSLANKVPLSWRGLGHNQLVSSPWDSSSLSHTKKGFFFELTGPSLPQDVSLHESLGWLVGSIVFSSFPRCLERRNSSWSLFEGVWSILAENETWPKNRVFSWNFSHFRSKYLSGALTKLKTVFSVYSAFQ